ncbi:MAG: hypothetical protein GY811_30420 [Myxococcales bacterium]|nr:hypothetical protein [Myxococcales bacterium]
MSARKEDTKPPYHTNEFRRLFLLLTPTANGGVGTGLGLAVSYEIIQSNGGSLSLDTIYKSGCRFLVSPPPKHQSH